jgi:hypothetical protein
MIMAYQSTTLDMADGLAFPDGIPVARRHLVKLGPAANVTLTPISYTEQTTYSGW